MACRAGLWYNEEVNIVAPAVLETPKGWIHSLEECIVDTLPQSAQNGKTTFIYALLDPNTQQVRYVGKSDYPHERLKVHIRESSHNPHSKHYSTHKANWIRTLIQTEKLPILQIIEEVSVDHWKERECYWIFYYREQGASLTNIAPGGIAHDYSPETIAKRVAKIKGRKHSEEHKRKIGASLKGRPVSQKTLEAFDRHRYVPKSEETRRKISEAQIGRKQSEETKKKISQANKGRGHLHTDETKELLRLKSMGNTSHLGHKHSAETRAKFLEQRKGKPTPQLNTEEARSKVRMTKLTNNAKKRGMTLDEYMLVRKEHNPKYMKDSAQGGDK